MLKLEARAISAAAKEARKGRSNSSISAGRIKSSLQPGRTIRDGAEQRQRWVATLWRIPRAVSGSGIFSR